MSKVIIKKPLKKIILLIVTIIPIIFLIIECCNASGTIYQYILGIVVTVFLSHLISSYINVSDVYSFSGFLKAIWENKNLSMFIPFVIFAIAASLFFCFFGAIYLVSDSTFYTAIAFFVSAIYMPLIIAYAFIFQEGVYAILVDYYETKNCNQNNKWLSLKLTFQHLLFYVLLCFTFVGRAYVLSFGNPHTVIELSTTAFIVYMIILDFIFIYTSPFNSIHFFSKIKATFRLGKQRYEVVDHGSNNYSINKYGSSGTTSLFLALLINLIFSPFGILLEIYKLIVEFIKIVKHDEINYFDGSEYFESKESNKRLALPFLSAAFLVIQMLTYRSIYNLNQLEFLINNAYIQRYTSVYDQLVCDIDLKTPKNKQFTKLNVRATAYLDKLDPESLYSSTEFNIYDKGEMEILISINRDSFCINSDSYLSIEILNLDFGECSYNYGYGDFVLNYSLEAFSLDKIDSEKYDEAVSLFNDGKFEDALLIFESISTYKDSSDYIIRCRNEINEQVYQEALSLFKLGNYDEAIKKFEEIIDYKDANTMVYECIYQKAIIKYEENKLSEAFALFSEIDFYKDSQLYVNLITDNLNALAIDYATQGEYDEALKILDSIGQDKENSKLYSACLMAIKGIYQDITNLLDLKRVIVYSKLDELTDNAFYDCSLVTEVVLPEGMTKIGAYSFADCYSLNKVILPDSIVKIGDYAFRNCRLLTSFSVPDNLKSIGSNILSGCTSLTKISTKLSNQYSIGSFFCDTPSSLTSNPNWPSSLTEIEITGGDVIPQDFFKFLPNTVLEIKFNENITEIGDYAFSESDVGFIIPETTKKIGDYAYSYLGRIGDVITLPQNLEIIENGSFYGTYFKIINLPGSLKSIGSSVFGSSTTNSYLEKINFDGTKDQWLSIVNLDWDSGMGDYYDVECTDAIFHHSLYDAETGWIDK